MQQLLAAWASCLVGMAGWHQVMHAPCSCAAARYSSEVQERGRCSVTHAATQPTTALHAFARRRVPSLPSSLLSSAARITASVHESLARLGLEYVDLIQCHDIEFTQLDQASYCAAIEWLGPRQRLSSKQCRCCPSVPVVFCFGLYSRHSFRREHAGLSPPSLCAPSRLCR